MNACMSGTRGSGVLSSTGGVLEMSVARGVGGLCDMCMCFAWGGVHGDVGEWMKRLGLGFTNPGGVRGSVGRVCVLVAVVWVVSVGSG